MPKLSVILIVDSPLANQLLSGISLFNRALSEATLFAEQNGADVVVVNDGNLQKHLQEIDADIFVIHDALRPLVTASQMQRTYDALGKNQASRPTMAFTETLKSVGQNNRLEATIDRTKVRRISSPEVIRKTAIDFKGELTTWSVPLVADYESCEVEANPESIRINSVEEIRMLEALLQLSNPEQM